MLGSNIGKSLEQSIIEHSFNSESVEKLVKLPHTNPHDIEDEIDEYKIQTIDGEEINRNISIKTTKGNIVNCSDAVIFINELNESINTKKHFDMIIIKWKRINCTDVQLRYFRINLNSSYKHGLFYNMDNIEIDLKFYLNELIILKKKIALMNRIKVYNNETLTDENKTSTAELNNKYNLQFLKLHFKIPNFEKSRPGRLQISFYWMKYLKYLKSLDSTAYSDVVRAQGTNFQIVTVQKKNPPSNYQKTGIKPKTLDF